LKQIRVKICEIPLLGRTKSTPELNDIERRFKQLEREINRVAEKSQSSKIWKNLETIENDQNRIFLKFSQIDNFEKKIRKLEDLELLELKSNVSQSSRKSDKRSKTERKLREDFENLKIELIKQKDQLNNFDDSISELGDIRSKFKTRVFILA